MFTSTVGKTFLTEYNKRNNKNYSAKEFFDEELFRLFFDDKKYLMWAQNSPFVQGVSLSKNGELGLRDRVKDAQGETRYFTDESSLSIMTDSLKQDSSILEFEIKKRKGKSEKFIETLNVLSPQIREEKLSEFHDKIIEGERDASIAIGYPASEIKEFATTSGLVTDIDISVDEEQVYLSWIGGTLSLGVSGGYAILFDHPEITYATYKGWKVYRKYLNDPVLDKLRPNQVVTWNGQWLTYCFDKRFREDFNFNDLLQRKAIEKSEDKIEVTTVEWSQMFFSLSNRFPSEALTGYVFSLGQTNKTIGFIPFQLKSGRKLHEIYQQLFPEDFEVNATDFEALFGKHIKRACELGNIGLQALEPKNLAKYFADPSNLNLVKPDLKQKSGEVEADYEKRKSDLLKKDRDNLITFQTYKTWLTAMISKNKTEISDYTRDIAASLVKYREGARKTDRKNLLEKKLFVTKRKTEFLEALIEIVKDESVEREIIDKMNDLRDRVHLMSQEDFVYFVLLLKFDYAYAERIS